MKMKSSSFEENATVCNECGKTFADYIGKNGQIVTKRKQLLGHIIGSKSHSPRYRAWAAKVLSEDDDRFYGLDVW